MHPALQRLIDEAETAMSTRPHDAPALIRRRARELERAHAQAIDARRKTLNAMQRDGLTAGDLLLAITRLHAIANRTQLKGAA